MSYILDALARAQADRERDQGAVPGLATRVFTPSTHDKSRGVWGRRTLAVAGVLLFVVIGAGLVGVGWSGPDSRTKLGVNEALAPPAASDPVLQPSVPLESIALARDARAVAAVAPPRVTRNASTTPVVASKAPADRHGVGQTVELASATTPMSPVPPAPAPGTAAPAPAASVDAQRVTGPHATPGRPVPWLKDLPPVLLQQVPALAISGAVDSENPSQRLLLVNGQVLTQGSEVAPGLRIEEIRSSVSEFSFRGTRFRLKH